MPPFGLHRQVKKVGPESPPTMISMAALKTPAENAFTAQLDDFRSIPLADYRRGVGAATAARVMRRMLDKETLTRRLDVAAFQSAP